MIEDGADLLAQALRNRIEFEGHSLNYDAENDVIWITNPYGVDSGMMHPSTQACQSFIDQARAGVVYGPSPE